MVFWVSLGVLKEYRMVVCRICVGEEKETRLERWARSKAVEGLAKHFRKFGFCLKDDGCCEPWKDLTPV